MMVYCSFCGKKPEEVKKITFSGNNALSVMNVWNWPKSFGRSWPQWSLADLSEVPVIELLILNHYVIGQISQTCLLVLYTITTAYYFHDTREESEDVICRSRIWMTGPLVLETQTLAKSLNVPLLLQMRQFPDWGAGVCGWDVENILLKLCRLLTLTSNVQSGIAPRGWNWQNCQEERERVTCFFRVKECNKPFSRLMRE